MEWSQILCSLVGFTKTNTELFLLRQIATLTSIQARIILLKIFLVHFAELQIGCSIRYKNTSVGNNFLKCKKKIIILIFFNCFS